MKPVIFVDLDETLWYARAQSLLGMNMRQDVEQSLALNAQRVGVGNERMREILARREASLLRELEQAKNATTINFPRGPYDFVVNPQADRVLSELKKHGDLYVFTAATRDYAEAGLAALGLAHYFKRLYSTRDEKNDWRKVEGRPFVLLDDAPGATLKVAWALGVTESPTEYPPEETRDELRAKYIAQVDPPFHLGGDGAGLVKAAQRALLLLQRQRA